MDPEATVAPPQEKRGHANHGGGDAKAPPERKPAGFGADAKAPPPETKHIDKSIEFLGCAKGKYLWTDADTSNKDADADTPSHHNLITKYSWSDGKKAVSVYVELDGLDDVAEDNLRCDSGDSEASLTIVAIGTPPKRKVLRLPSLYGTIDGVKLARKLGKNTVVLKLQKREERPWPQLLQKSGG
mmetsp:Transcript_23701/g.70538  ORF Transcript_23701/g.70538 Transcript_23701/m.70538 type:complete len:185 (-) Transcript_23701:119-673(-)